MGIQRKKKNRAGFTFTAKKLRLLIVNFLAEHEVHMTADYKPASEEWRQALAKAMTEHILKNS